MSISRRPYLIRAIHEWICDSELTPYIVVDATAGDDVMVPPEHVSEGKITLNISAHATESLNLGNETVSFAARFGGKVFSVRVPCHAVLGIYARETREGLIFSPEEPSPGPGDDGGADKTTRPSLKIVR